MLFDFAILNVVLLFYEKRLRVREARMLSIAPREKEVKPERITLSKPGRSPVMRFWWKSWE